MIFTAENTLLIGSILLFVSIVVGKTGYRFGVPTLLLFLVVGMLFGSDGLGLQFHDAKDAQFIGMVALSIILFSGGMDTKFREIKPILGPGIVLSTVGVLLTALFTGLFIWWISGMSWSNIYLPITTSLLLASTMSSTDSASVFAILRSQKMNLKHNLRPMLELESGSNDPMAYMLTIVLIQFIQSSGMGVGAIVGSFVIQFIVGAAAGYVLGKLAIRMLNKLNIDNQALYPILLLAFVFFTFSITDLLKGNGYLAVYIAGIMVGYLTSSLVTLLSSMATSQGVQSYVMWGMGTFSGVNTHQLPFFSISTAIGLLLALLLAKPLNILMLGDGYARNLGVNVDRVRIYLLLITGLLTAVVTAYCGPVAFIGLSVPHIARMIWRTDNHWVLFPATMLCGAIVALGCCLLSVIPDSNVIPINALTPIVGVPVVLYVILKKR